MSRLIPLVFSFGLLLVLGVSGFARPVFKGDVSYEFASSFKHVSLEIERITTRGALTPTGTIRVSLWATDEEFSGGKLSGTRLTSFKLRGLLPGKSWEGISHDLPTEMPPLTGHYYLLMTIEEYFSDGGYKITDWMPVDERVYLVGSGPKPKPKPKIRFEAPFEWEYVEERAAIRISTGQVINSREGSSGSMKIIVWLTPTRYEGGPMNGYIAGHAELEPLEQGMMYDKIDFLVRYQEPPAGDYFVCFTLSEWDGEGYVIMDHHSFDEPARF
jgi:hypothetical protein